MLKNFFKKILLFLQNKCRAFKVSVSESFSKARNGEESFGVVLYYWSLIPCILYFICLKFVNCVFLLEVIDVFIVLLAILDLYFIARAVEVHPEYDSELVKEKEKEEYYKTLTEEQLIEVKKKEQKDNRNKIFKKYILLKSDEKVDMFKLIRLFVIITLLIAVKRILL